MSVQFAQEEFVKLKNMLIVYEWGLKTMTTKLDIINEDFKSFQSYNPIEHITKRMKAPESIAEKLQRNQHDITADNAKAHVKDIAGIRIICSYARDINNLVEILKSLPDISIIEEKDYITKPKESGYRSYHVITEVPVYCSHRTEVVPVEVQIRTAAMDFWASLEHKVRYKYKEHIPKHLSDELVLCADKITELDNRMFLIHDIVSLINQE